MTRAHAAVAALFAWTMISVRADAQEGPDHARRRWEWFHQQRAFPFAEIAPGALERARAQLAGLRSRLRLSEPPPIGGSRWEPLGPTLVGASAIGRISTIAIHPTASNTIYIGGAQGGVWKTTNGGGTWAPLTDRECSLAMGSIALDPANPEIIYAATGEQHFSADSYYGCGVLRSTNGGASWTRLGASVFVRSRISRLLIVPPSTGEPAQTTLLAASDNGLWRSFDGGTTWTQLRTGTVTDLVLDPTNALVVYAAIRTQGVFRSADGGSTWASLGAGFPVTNVGRINIGLAPSAPSTLYAAVHNTSNNQLLGIYKTSDAGVSWAQLSATGASCSTQCWYDLFVAVHPTNPNTVFFGGVSLYRSLDGGATFANITGGVHADQHFLTFDPQNPDRALVANDGGVYQSLNAGNSWTALNNGLALTQFYGGISLHPSDPDVVLGGTQDNGTLAYAGVPNWTVVIGADGGFTAIDPENPQIRYGETQWTANSTISGPRRSDGGTFVRKINGINLADGAAFIPPLVMHPTVPRTLYFGTNRVYRTDDRAESWRAISGAFGGALSALAPAPSDTMVMYVGTSIGQLHVSGNGGEAWTLSTSGLPARYITDIAVDRGDARTAYVTVSGFGTGHVFRTVNRGASWTNVSSNLPDMPVNAVVVDPASRAFVMIGTDLGVFVSADSGTTWTVLDDGMPNVAVFDIAYNAATGALVAATHGRGMFRLQLDRPLTLAAVPRRRRADVLENASAPIADSSAIVLSGPGAGTAAWTATHTSAPWLTLTTSAGAGSGRVRWVRNPTGLAPGFYVDTITVTSTGAVDSPVRVIDTLFVEAVTPTVSVSPPTQTTTLPAGAPQGTPDSAQVSFSGVLGGQTAWTAAPRVGTWLTLTTASGVGPGMVRWVRAPGASAAGVFVDTIVVTAPGAIGSPALIIDTLVVQLALVVTPGSQRDSLVSGTSTVKPVTAQLTIAGDPGGNVEWTATHGAASWLTLTTTSGRGSAALAWSKSAVNLRDGVFIDTITVSAQGAPIRRIVDTLIVVAPAVSTACVLDQAFGVPCLDSVQSRWLDLAGNRDGAFNLGDLMAYLARGNAGPPAPARRRE